MRLQSPGMGASPRPSLLHQVYHSSEFFSMSLARWPKPGTTHRHTPQFAMGCCCTCCTCPAAVATHAMQIVEPSGGGARRDAGRLAAWRAEQVTWHSRQGVHSSPLPFAHPPEHRQQQWKGHVGKLGCGCSLCLKPTGLTLLVHTTRQLQTIQQFGGKPRTRPTC